MPELAGKARRVSGVFVFMMGAGAILDRHLLWLGAVGMAIGVAVFVWGMIEARARTAEASSGASAENQSVAATQPTESRP